jgi:hypothetical protein
MLFDLRGRRRRAVQATYLILALLMGGGLVLFGIGGSVSGGLLDAFKGTGGGGGNDAVEERIERNQERLAENPGNTVVLKALVRDNYQLAVSNQEPNATSFPDDARDDLRQAATYWQRYLEQAKSDPDASLASVALRLYDQGALGKPKDAARAMAIVANASNDFQSYLQLVQYAALAGDERTANLAAQKAEDLAPKDLKKEVKQQAAQLQKAAKQQQAAG